MDNLTHAIVGLAAGELIHRLLPSEPDIAANKTRRRLLLTGCALASNFPDLDLFLTPLIEKPLGYLLHHRGHTHTMLFAIPQALLLALAMYLLWPRARRLVRENGIARKGWIGAIAAGFVLHLAMDFLNSYGIHPFYPFDSRWFYGDLVFIIEPFFWVACGVPLMMTIHRRWLRAVFLLTLFGLLLLFAVKQYLLWSSLLLMLAVAAALIIADRMVLRRHSKILHAVPMVAGFALALVFISVQVVTSTWARAEVSQQLASANPSRTLLDAAMTALPSNPLCWNFVSVETDEATNRIHVTNGRLSLAPELLNVRQCPSVMSPPLSDEEIAGDFLVLQRTSGDLAKLRALGKDDCRVAAWLRFARIPMLSEDAVWDARYSMREGGGNFSHMMLDAEKATGCSPWIPGWTLPRADLYAPSL